MKNKKPTIFSTLCRIKFDVSGVLNEKSRKDIKPIITTKGTTTTCVYVPKDKKKWN